MPTKSVGLLVFLILCQVDAIQITLQPGMEEIVSLSPSVPLSWTSSREECDAQYGMDLSSDVAYQWITSPGSNLNLTADCVVAQVPYTTRAVFWDYLGRAVHVEELGNAPCAVPLDIEIQGNGVYLVTLDAIDTNGVWQSRLVRSVSAIPDNSDRIDTWRNTNDFVVGSCFFPHRYGVWSAYNYPDMTPDEVIDAIASVAEQVGFQALRVDYNYGLDSFETDRMDTIVSILTNHNQKINFKLDARFAAYAVEPVLSAWTSNVVAFVQRYEDSAWLFEVGNEPSHAEFFDGDWEDYLTLLSNAYIHVKSAVPSALVVNGGMCPWTHATDETPSDLEWYENFIANGATCNDLVAYHFHGTLTGAEETRWIPDYKSMYMQAGGEDIPWVQTEGGMCFWRVAEDVSQSPYLMQKIFWSWASGDKGWMQFALFANVSSSWANTNSINWSIFDEATFCAKFPVGQISALINRFAGYAAGQVIFENDTLTLLKFVASDNRTALVGFSKDGINRNALLEFDGPVAELYDPQGNRVGTSSNGTMDVEFSAYPCWVETTGDIRPLLLDGVDETLVTDLSFEHVLFGTSDWGTNQLVRDLDDSIYNLDAVIRQHNNNVSVDNGVVWNGLHINWRWGGYAEVDLSSLGLDLSELTVSMWAKVNRWDADYYDNKAFWSLLADDGGSIALTTGGGSASPCLQSYNGGIDGVPYFQSPWGLDYAWRMVTVVFSESAGTVRFYDGVSNLLTVADYSPDLVQTLTRFRVGNRFDAENNALKGDSDEIRIYNRALTPEEVVALYDETKTSATANPAGYADFLDLYRIAGDPMADPNDDYDGDGRLNICEYALGGDPTNALNTGIKPVFSFGADDEVHFSHVILTDPDADVLYDVEQTDALESPGGWTHGGWSRVVTNATGDAAFDEVQYQILGGDKDKLFIRLRLIQP